ncbi:MAG TPA: helicase RepA family protein [Oscillospiraceae bacterium]|nr:helicase RepA family protein [Oscillospiraceae bacterium]
MENKKMTTPIVSVGADTEQSPNVCNDSITDFNEDSKSLDDYLEEMQKEFSKQMSPSYLKTVSMSELYDTVFNVQTPLINGLLQRGTYIFAGSPKAGKSFMMAQLAYHISTGTPLWGYKVRKSTVLYFALEDDYPRLQKRLFQMFGAEETDNLYFATQCKTLNEGLDEQIKGFMEEHSDTGLIIIDTLKRVREAGGADYSYASDYDIVARLKSLADSYNVTMLIVHHTRKQKAEDIFDMISGTNGLMGAADGAFVLSKEKRTSNSATLEVSGRDQPDQKIYLNRNPETLVWELERTETELWKLPPEPLLENIAVKITNENPEWYGSPTELVEFLGVEMKANALTMKLNINAGRLFDEYGIRYQNKRCHDGRKVSLTYEQRDDV